MTASDTQAATANVVNIDDAPETSIEHGDFWEGPYRNLTPRLSPQAGRLGVRATRVPPGKSACPFHAHFVADEVFFVLSGRGVFRYGDTIRDIKKGDCIACPAGTGVAHQIANPFDQELVYLGIGLNPKDEVCTYPDSGKVWVEFLNRHGFLREAGYYEGEPETPAIVPLMAKQLIDRDESSVAPGNANRHDES